MTNVLVRRQGLVLNFRLGSLIPVLSLAGRLQVYTPNQTSMSVPPPPPTIRLSP